MPVILGLLSVLAAAGAFYQFIGTRRAARSYAPPGALIDIDGQRLHMVCDGDGGPAVVFESGIAASSLSWARVLREVALSTRACAYDRAGLGWSDPSRAPRRVARILRELQGVLEHAAAAPCVLVGHSFGAFLVWIYASRRPADVAGLVLLDPPGEWRELTPDRARLLWGGIQMSRLGGLLARLGVVRACLALLSGGAPGVPRHFVRIFGPTTTRTLERLVGEVQKLPPEVHPIVQEIWCQPKCFQAMAAHLGALDETAAAACAVTQLPDVPMVIISAGNHSAATIAAHQELARLTPQGRHIVAAKSGHWIQFDQPELVVETIREIVDRARRMSQSA